jgi:hypothetical protein
MRQKMTREKALRGNGLGTHASSSTELFRKKYQQSAKAQPSTFL